MKVLVTGFCGLGEEIVQEFLNNNYDVIATYNKNKDYSTKKVSELNHVNNNIKLIKCDLTDENDIKSLVLECSDIDILINNASVSLDSHLEEKTKDEFMEVLETNVVGTFLLTRECILKTNVKTIVNISSTDSVDTYSNYNIDYSISKSGINLMTNILADYYKDKKIITVLPNWIDTKSVLEMNKEYLESELNRIGQNELLKKEVVAKKIYEVATNEKYKTKDVIRIG